MREVCHTTLHVSKMVILSPEFHLPAVESSFSTALGRFVLYSQGGLPIERSWERPLYLGSTISTRHLWQSSRDGNSGVAGAKSLLLAK